MQHASITLWLPADDMPLSLLHDYQYQALSSAFLFFFQQLEAKLAGCNAPACSIAGQTLKLELL
jgi:hypothetical protein